MRKIGCIFMIAFALLTSCTSKTYDFDIYRSYKNSLKGLELYCWKQNYSWYSGILPGTNRLKSIDEVEWLQVNAPCPIKTMKSIVDDYKKENVFIDVYIVSAPPKVEELSHTPDYSQTYMWIISELGLTGYNPTY